MEIKNGKKPLASKPRQPSPSTLDDIFGNALAVSAEVADAITKKGNEYRWISSRNTPRWGTATTVHGVQSNKANVV
jgi:hypothetical protein